MRRTPLFWRSLSPQRLIYPGLSKYEGKCTLRVMPYAPKGDYIQRASAPITCQSYGNPKSSASSLREPCCGLDKKEQNGFRFALFLELVTRLELATCWLRISCTTDCATPATYILYHKVLVFAIAFEKFFWKILRKFFLRQEAVFLAQICLNLSILGLVGGNFSLRRMIKTLLQEDYY